MFPYFTALRVSLRRRRKEGEKGFPGWGRCGLLLSQIVQIIQVQKRPAQ